MFHILSRRMSHYAGRIKYGRCHSCFIALPSAWIRRYDTAKVCIFKLQWADQHLFVTWAGDISNTAGGDEVSIDAVFARTHNLKNKQEVVISECEEKPDCSQIFVSPASEEDWEIMKLHTGFIEDKLMEQIRVVSRGQNIPIWINNSTHLILKTDAIEPQLPYVILMNQTELIVDTKYENDLKDQVHPVTPNSSVNSSPGVVRRPGPLPLGRNEVRPLVSEAKACPDIGKNPFVAGKENPKIDNSYLSNLTSRINSLLSGKPELKVNPEVAHTSPVNKERFYLAEEFQSQLVVYPLSSVQHDNHIGISESSHSYPNNLFSHPSCVFISEAIFRRVTITKHTPPKTFLATLSTFNYQKEAERRVRKQSKMRLKSGHVAAKDMVEEDGIGDIDKDLIEHRTVVMVHVVRTTSVLHNLIVEETREKGQKMFSWEWEKWQKYILVPKGLRRLLVAPGGSQVTLASLRPTSGIVSQLVLHPALEHDSSLTSDIISNGFKKWLKVSLTSETPSVFSSGQLVNIMTRPGIFQDFIIEINDTVAAKSKVKPSPLQYLVIVEGDSDLNVTYDPNPMNLPRIETWMPELDHLVEQFSWQHKLVNEMLCYLQNSIEYNSLQERQHRPSGRLAGGLLLVGGRGSGRSSLAKLLAYSLKKPPSLAYTIILDCKQLRGKRHDVITSLHFFKVFHEAVRHQPAVVILDDLDLIAGVSNNAEQEQSPEALYFSKVAHGLKSVLADFAVLNVALTVVAVAQSTKSLHPCLLAPRGYHFFEKRLEIQPPDLQARLEILTYLHEQEGGDVAEDELLIQQLKDLSNEIEGFTLCDLNNLWKRAKHCHQLRQLENVGDECRTLNVTDVKTALKNFTPSLLQGVTPPDVEEVKWENVGGLEHVKSLLLETLEWPMKYPDLYKECPLRLRSGILLYGAPGTGKTLIARALASHCKLQFISIKGPELLSKYIGASEQAVRNVFERAKRMKPCIVFFDEFDSLAPKRGHDSTGVTDRVVNQLLTELDGVEGMEGVYVLAASNRPDLIDPALLRPGRIDSSIQCPMPDQVSREAILRIMCQHLNLSSDVDLPQVAEMCERFSGADFKALVYNANLKAIHEIKDKASLGLPSINPERNADSSKSPQVVESNDSQPKEPLQQMVLEKTSSKDLGAAFIPQLGQMGSHEQIEEQLSKRRQAHTPNSSSQPSRPGVVIRQEHFLKAASELSPSLSTSEAQRFEQIFFEFSGYWSKGYEKKRKDVQQKATLA